VGKTARMPDILACTGGCATRGQGRSVLPVGLCIVSIYFVVVDNNHGIPKLSCPIAAKMS
jgi:hypothetical protein